MTTWNRDLVEETAREAIDAGLVSGPLKSGSAKPFECRVPGVIAFERMETTGRDDLDWPACAQAVADATGLVVLAVAHCDWSFDDRCDEEATFIAFDVPGVPEDYAAPHGRNRIAGAAHPRTAPTG